MWGFAPFYIPDNYAIDVRNLSAAREWYKEKLGLQEIHDRKEDDSGRPFADVCLFRSRESKSREKVGVCSLIELEPGTAPEKRHVIFTRDTWKRFKNGWLIVAWQLRPSRTTRAEIASFVSSIWTTIRSKFALNLDPD